MKFFIQFIAIAAAAYILELFLPWWSIAIAAFLCGYFIKSKVNFLSGLLGIGLLWAGKAWLIDASAAVPLADRVATIFSLNKTTLVLVTALIGGIVGGFAAMAGASLKKKKAAITDLWQKTRIIYNPCCVSFQASFIFALLFWKEKGFYAKKHWRGG